MNPQRTDILTITSKSKTLCGYFVVYTLWPPEGHANLVAITGATTRVPYPPMSCRYLSVQQNTLMANPAMASTRHVPFLVLLPIRTRPGINCGRPSRAQWQSGSICCTHQTNQSPFQARRTYLQWHHGSWPATPRLSPGPKLWRLG